MQLFTWILEYKIKGKIMKSRRKKLVN